jgi:glycosyltransferase involved in cell wall biosynthesis
LGILSSPDGGLAHYVVHLWRRLSAWFEPTFVTYADRKIDDLVREHIPRPQPLLDPHRPASIDECALWLRQRGIRLVNLHVGTRAKVQADYFCRLLSALRRQGARIVLTLHDVMPFSPNGCDPAALRRLYALGHAYLVGNAEQREELLTSFEVGPRPVLIAPHGPYTLLDNRRYCRATARQLLGLPADAPVVLFFGQLRAGKDLECIVRALPVLQARVPEALLFIHVDDRGVPHWHAQLHSIAAAGRQRGIWMTIGYAPAERIEPIFRAADVAALSYSAIAQSGVLNLARTFELPTVITEAFPHCDRGDPLHRRVVPANDPAALATALAELLLHPSSATRRSALAKERARPDWQLNAANFRRACAQLTICPSEARQTPQVSTGCASPPFSE